MSAQPSPFDIVPLPEHAADVNVNSTADLTTPEGLAAYLAPTKFAAADVQTLSGGSAGFTYRVALKTPEASGEKSVVVKHSLGHASSSETLILGRERMTFEYEALEAIYQSGLFTPASTVQLPRVLHYDPETYTLIMTDLAPARTLSSVLIEAFENGTIEAVSARLGAALGDFMGRFHRWSSMPEQEALRRHFLENSVSRETVLGIRYWLMNTTAEKYGMKKDWMDDMTKEGMADAATGGSVIAMADFWLDNVLVITEPELRIYIIDWEMSRCARPELDVAHFATAAHSVVHLYPSSAADFKLMQNFMRGYNEHFKLETVRVALSAGRDVLSFGVMMPWIRHRDESVKQAIVQCGADLLEAAHTGDVGRIIQNVVVRDMYTV
ncbi:phosphotransferase enzyme family protein [Ceratobasidium sp. AG-Ba]|nr:phosphotransferase enzyme family protein [Ceratobasidium sp. AG-Ba]QRW10931.1 phosphotransferase enzyme family protein [Ceratobasidium sp. AG-Ba]